MKDVSRYASTFFSEVPGRDREEAVLRFYAHLNSASKGRRLPAEERVRVVRVRRLGPNWWSVA